jgi:hypothetical protein
LTVDRQQAGAILAWVENADAVVRGVERLISFKPRLLRRGTFKVGREVTAEVIPEYIKKQGKQTRHKNSDCSERNPAPWGGVIHWRK